MSVSGKPLCGKANGYARDDASGLAVSIVDGWREANQLACEILRAQDEHVRCIDPQNLPSAYEMALRPI